MLFNNFRKINPKGDLFGGVTAAIISLPLALTFGVASGAGAEAGLWGAILVGFFAALFGGTSTLISEPTGPMTVIMTAILATMMAKNPENGLAMAFTVVMMAGLFQIILGSLKLGKYITMMPYSVISGFMSGIGIILIILQFAPLLGHPAPPGGVIGTLNAAPDLLMDIHAREVILGMGTLLILFLLPKRYTRIMPVQLSALLLMTIVSLILFSGADIRRIGPIPSGLPSIQWPTFTAGQVQSMFLDALVLGTLGCIDTLLTAVISDSLTRREHNSDKELVGQGIANMVSGFFGGLPGAGATMGTVVTIQSGGKSPLSGIVRAVILLIVVLGAAKLTAPIPLAVLAAIALHVGFNILDWSFLQRVHKVSAAPTIIMYGVMILTVFVDLIVAVGLGVFIANIITIERLSHVQARNVKAISDADDSVPLTDEERVLLDRAKGKVLFFYLSGPMIFGVSKAIARQHKTVKRYRAMILDLSAVPMIDVTICMALENAIRDALEAGCAVYLYCPNRKTLHRVEALGLGELIPAHHMVSSRKEALELALVSIQKPK